MTNRIRVTNNPPAIPFEGEIDLTQLRAWHEEQHAGQTPPPEPPPVDPPPVEPPPVVPGEFPYVQSGKYVMLGGRKYNTRAIDDGHGHFACDLGDGRFEISEANATATYCKEWVGQQGNYITGKVTWNARYDGGITSDIQGGNHYHQINSWHLQASQGTPIDGTPQLRFELDNLGSRPRGILWPYFTGEREMVVYLGDNFRVQEGITYEWTIEWGMDLTSGLVEITVIKDEIFIKIMTFMVDPRCTPFQFFYPMGHVGPQDGRIVYSNVVIE